MEVAIWETWEECGRKVFLRTADLFLLNLTLPPLGSLIFKWRGAPGILNREDKL